MLTAPECFRPCLVWTGTPAIPSPQRCAVRRAVNLSAKEEVQTLTWCVLCGLGQDTGPL